VTGETKLLPCAAISEHGEVDRQAGPTKNKKGADFSSAFPRSTNALFSN